MHPVKRKIEVDEAVAADLETRAAEEGRTVEELLADVAAAGAVPVRRDTAEIAELDRRWENARRPGSTVPHEDVVGWLETWGTPAFRPWRRKALADLNRFSEFLRERHPHLAATVAAEIVRKATSLAEHPFQGRRIEEREEYREIVRRVANARYVFQYRVEGYRGRPSGLPRPRGAFAPAHPSPVRNGEARRKGAVEAGTG